MPDDNTNTTPAAGSGIVFGLAEYKGAISGLRIQSVQHTKTGTPVDAIDEDGDLEQRDYHTKLEKMTVEANVVEGSDLSALVIGATVTINGEEWKIENDVVFRNGNTAHKTCTLNLWRKPPAASAGTSAQAGS